MATPLVGLIMGSRSDWETMRHAAETLDELGIPHERRVVSAHRTPDLLFEYAATAEERGLRVLIAGAGGAAHLPGMTAAKTTLPVLGVPVESKALSGMDSLLSIVQMPAGDPGRDARDRPRRRRQRRAPRGVDPRASATRRVGERLRVFRAAQTQAVLDSPDPAARCDDPHERMTLVACIGGGQLGRMLGLAGLPLGLSFRFLDPAADACAGAVGELVVGEYGDPRCARAPGGRGVRRHLRVRERAGRGGCGRRRGARGRGPRARAGPAAREGAVSLARHPDGALRGARGDRRAGAREDPSPRLRRQGAAPGRGDRAARRRRARRGARPVRPRAVDRRRPRTRRRDTLLAGRRERPSRGHPARHARPRPGCAAGGGRGDLHDAPRRARLRRRPRRRALRGRRAAARERVRAAGAQHRALDDRRRRHEPVREPPASDPRPAARRDRGDGSRP